jgi:hypothetical protein
MYHESRAEQRLEVGSKAPSSAGEHFVGPDVGLWRFVDPVHAQSLSVRDRSGENGDCSDRRPAQFDHGDVSECLVVRNSFGMETDSWVVGAGRCGPARVRADRG